MLYTITGLGNLGWGPLGNPLVFLGSLLALGAAYLGSRPRPSRSAVRVAMLVG